MTTTEEAVANDLQSSMPSEHDSTTTTSASPWFTRTLVVTAEVHNPPEGIYDEPITRSATFGDDGASVADTAADGVSSTADSPVVHNADIGAFTGKKASEVSKFSVS